MQSLAIFPLFYLPSTSYFSALAKSEYSFLIEKHEHFPKQTNRNRTRISSPNGTLDLYIPVIKGSKYHTVIKNVKISDDFEWQRLHWRSLQSCYRNSAYFEYYEDEFAQFYHQKYKYLFDYNLELFEWILKQLKIKYEPQFTEEYLDNVDPALDFRGKKSFDETEDFKGTKEYFQVFDDRNGFLPNMSIVDLLFSQGPQAKSFL
jgi:hypothetical protein